MSVLSFALIPALALLFYVWYIDKLEHEPIKMILAAFGLGALSVIPAIIGEMIGDTVLGLILPEGSILYVFADCLLVIAPAEELSKRLVMRPIFWRNANFNCRFDAVVYCMASALGFAALENIEYGILDGISIGRLVPVHTICGLIMGYELGRARMAQQAGNRKIFRRMSFCSVLYPVLIHGSWDFLVSMDSLACELIALAGITALTIFTAIWVRRLAKFDAPFENNILNTQTPPEIYMNPQYPPVNPGSYDSNKNDR